MPTVETTSTDKNDAADILTHPVTLPSGITAGERVLVSFGCFGAPGVTFPGSVTKHLEASRGTDVTLAVGSFIAAGGETSINVTTGSGCRSSYTCYRISAAGAVTVGTEGTGSGTGPNPNAITGLPSNDYVVLALLAHQQNATVTSYPSNCADNRISTAGAGATSVTAAGAKADVTGTSFDPFSYLMSGSFPYVTVAVAVAPPALGRYGVSGGLGVGGRRISGSKVGTATVSQNSNA